MKILAIDTATEACSAALRVGSETIERFAIEPRGHTDLILPMVESLLDEGEVKLEQLDTLAVNRGPGSFTGVRICAGVVQGLAFAARLPVIPVSSLQVLAHQAYLKHGYRQVLAMIDARMNEVYWGTYQLDGSHMCLQGREQVGRVGSIPDECIMDYVAVGSGALEYLRDSDKVTINLEEELRLPRAATVATLAAELKLEKVAAEKFEPVYLRNNVVQT